MHQKRRGSPFDKSGGILYNNLKIPSLADTKGALMMHLDHDHPHSHPHEHECGEHIHCGEHVDCAACGQNHDPRAELLALMRYMVGHNTQHANELAGLAKKLDEMGDHATYEQVMQAVSDFEKGNLRLSTVLSSLDHPQ